MVKINDTVTFPITSPRKGDMVIGTDTSDTGNDPNGETVNFTVEGIQNVADTSSSWTWYDSENYGDSGEGVLFDFNVDGSGISSVDTPNFEDGYEYTIIFDEVASTTISAYRFIIDFENAANQTVNITPGNVLGISGRYEFISPRFSRKDHRFKTVYGPEENNVTALANPDRIVKITIGTGGTPTFNAGRILLARRRDHLT